MEQVHLTSDRGAASGEMLRMRRVKAHEPKEACATLREANLHASWVNLDKNISFSCLSYYFTRVNRRILEQTDILKII